MRMPSCSTWRAKPVHCERLAACEHCTPKRKGLVPPVTGGTLRAVPVAAILREVRSVDGEITPSRTSLVVILRKFIRLGAIWIAAAGLAGTRVLLLAHWLSDVAIGLGLGRALEALHWRLRNSGTAG